MQIPRTSEARGLNICSVWKDAVSCPSLYLKFQTHLNTLSTNITTEISVCIPQAYTSEHICLSSFPHAGCHWKILGQHFMITAPPLPQWEVTFQVHLSAIHLKIRTDSFCLNLGETWVLKKALVFGEKISFCLCLEWEGNNASWTRWKNQSPSEHSIESHAEVKELNLFPHITHSHAPPTLQ